MLDAYEILDLEKRWRGYNAKRGRGRFIRLIAIFIVFVSVGAITFIVGNNFYQKHLEEQTKIDLELKKQVDELKEKAKQARLKSLEKNKESESGDAIKLDIDSDILTPQIASNNSPQNTTAFVNGPQIASSNQNEYATPDPVTITEFDARQQANAPKLADSRPKILIDSKSVNLSIESLQQRFEATNDIKLAVRIAEEHYAKADYNNALKWAFTVNNLDEEVLDGWVIFAKAKYKTGKKDEAIKILENISKKYPSQMLEALLIQIKTDAL